MTIDAVRKVQNFTFIYLNKFLNCLVERLTIFEEMYMRVLEPSHGSYFHALLNENCESWFCKESEFERMLHSV